MKKIKNQINASDAHANLINANNNFHMNYKENQMDTPFFDFAEEHFIKAGLWQISNVALILMNLCRKVNSTKNEIVLVDDFNDQFQKFVKMNDELRVEMMGSDIYKKTRKK